MILPMFLFMLACSYGVVKSKEINFKEGTNTTVSPDLIVGSDAILKKSNPEIVSFINGRSVVMKQERNGWKY